MNLRKNSLVTISEIIIYGNSINNHDSSCFDAILDEVDISNSNTSLAPLYSNYITNPNEGSPQLINLITLINNYTLQKSNEELYDRLLIQGCVSIKEIK